MSLQDALARLGSGRLEPVGQIAGASNTTLLVRCGDDRVLAVYKPERGETPLWDFPTGTLHRREVAAFHLDRLLGWDMVPPTALRPDGPLGRGSVQLFVDHDPHRHYFALVEEDDPGVAAQLMRMVAFDLVANNADRKASHVLVDAEEKLWLVDHGVTFHVEHKLRTVAWEFAGEPVPAAIRADSRRAAAALAGAEESGGRDQHRDRDADDEERDPHRRQDHAARLAALLVRQELTALRERAEATAELERFPSPRGPRPYPWPPL